MPTHRAQKDNALSVFVYNDVVVNHSVTDCANNPLHHVSSTIKNELGYSNNQLCILFNDVVKFHVSLLAVLPSNELLVMYQHFKYAFHSFFFFIC